MKRTAGTLVLAVALLAGGAGAETLYHQDGITLEGTVQMVTRTASTCQVLAERHSAEVYERIKANHGQPLHVWQLNFAARNDSGKQLENLMASFTIAAEAPPCTSWSGPLDNYAKPVQWANSFQVLQKPDGMEPGEEMGDTMFVLAFQDHRPEFESWNVEYQFADEAGREAEPALEAPAFIVVTVPAHANVSLLNTPQRYRRRMPLEPGRYQVEVSAPGFAPQRVWVTHQQTRPHRIELERLPGENESLAVPAPNAAPAAELPPDIPENLHLQQAAQNAQLPQDIQVDRFMLRAEQAMERTEYDGARSALESVLKLEGRGARLPGDFHFLRARLSFQDGLYAQSLESLERYLVLAARGSERYREALELLDQAESLAFSDARTCLGKPDGSQCWMEVSNLADCHVWNFNLKEGSAVSWSGECADGTAHGEGTLSWEWPDRERSGTGTLLEGRKRGLWSERYADGTVALGAYSAAGRHGQWFLELANGASATGTYEHGSTGQDWSEREPIEIEGEYKAWWTGHGPYVDDRKHGYWSWVGSGWFEGDEREGPYVNGQPHGLWLYRDSGLAYPPEEGWILKGPYVDGKKHGIWTEYDDEGPYVEGKRHGRWVERWVDRLGYGEDDSTVESGEYADGERQGTWTGHYTNGGASWTFTYVNGERHGPAEWRGKRGIFAGDLDKGSYENGKRHGPWYEQDYDDHRNRYRAWEGEYVNGERHGEWVLRSGRRIGPGSGSIECRRTYDNGTVIRCRGRCC